MAFRRKAKAKAKAKGASALKPSAAVSVKAAGAQPSPPERFDPMREIGRLRREMERAFERMHRPWSPWTGQPLLPAFEGLDVDVPALDVYQEKDAVVVTAELPGVDKKDVAVSIEGNVLTVRGEKHKEEDVREGDYSRKERSYGAVSRTVRLPVEVNADKASASFKNGVLTIRVAKADAAGNESRNVKVQ